MPGRLARCAAATAALLPLLAAGSPAAGSARSGAGGLQESFAAAARQYGVPESVLLGVAYLESRWDAHGGAPSVAGGYGPMHLTDLRAATGGPHGSGAVGLHTRPASGAPLVGDPGLHGDAPASTGVNDTGARASTGQQFAVAGRRGDWTAIWYLGRKAWFHNPAAALTALPDDGATLSPRPGAGPVRVYGRALPEASAYPEGVEPEEPRPLPYELRPGQRYVVGDTMPGEHFHAPGLTDETGAASRVIRGRTLWHQIQVGHRTGYVRAADVTVVRPRSDGQPNV